MNAGLRHVAANGCGGLDGVCLLKATKDTVDQTHIVSFVALSGRIALRRIRYKAGALIEQAGETWQRHEFMRS